MTERFNPQPLPAQYDRGLLGTIFGKIARAIPWASTVGRFNVLDYGAKCDGVTDDRAALVAAAADAAAESGAVELPPGRTMFLGSTATLTGAIHLMAYGATVKGTALANRGLIFSGNSRVSGGTFDNVWTAWSGTGVTQGGVRGARYINQTYNPTGALSGARGVVVEGCYFTGRSRGPLGTSTYPCFQLVTGAAGCHFLHNVCEDVESGVTYDGINATNGLLTVAGNEFRQLTYYALKTDVGEGVTFRDNWVEDSVYGIFYEAIDAAGSEVTRDSMQQLVVDGNTFKDVSAAATNFGGAISTACIYVAAADNPYARLVVTNNYFHECDVGIARGAGRLLTRGNQFYGGYHFIDTLGYRSGMMKIGPDVIDGTGTRYRSAARTFTFTAATSKISGFVLADLQRIFLGDYLNVTGSASNNGLQRVAGLDFSALTITVSGGAALVNETVACTVEMPVDWEGQQCAGGIAVGSSVQDSGSNYTPIVDISRVTFRRCAGFGVLVARDASAFPNVAIKNCDFDAGGVSASHVRVSTAALLQIEGNRELSAPTGERVDLDSTAGRLTASTTSYRGNSWQRVGAAPASGYHLQGEEWANNAPAAGGTMGWVCTTSGTPGTWKTFGTIAP